MPDDHSQMPSPTTLRSFQFEIPLGVIRFLLEQCSSLADLGGVSISVNYYNYRVVKISRTKTTTYDLDGYVTKNDDSWNNRMYNIFQHDALRNWMRFGKLTISLEDDGEIEEIIPSPSFKKQEIVSPRHLSGKQPSKKNPK